MNKEEILQLIRQEMEQIVRFQNPTFEHHINLLNGVDLRVGGETGSRIGTSSTEKLGFYGATPIIRPTAISAPSGGATQDTQARAALTDIITKLSTLGLTA
jgi:hypothetical protein